jgi:hypothetical protein
VVTPGEGVSQCRSAFICAPDHIERCGSGVASAQTVFAETPEQKVSAMFDTASCQRQQDHKEAVRLARMSHHIPYGGIIVVSFVLFNLLSVVSSILAIGPANGMP